MHGIRHDPENKVYEYNGNGLIKDYNRYGYLIFEGEYLNGLRNGKGKEYNYDNLVFEGEYLNGFRNGKGKEYDSNGDIVFEGEYLNDKKWNGKNNGKNTKILYDLKDGKGFLKKFHEYNGELELLFGGEFLNGELNGKARYFSRYVYLDINQTDFEGEYKNNKRQGKGKEFLGEDRLIFEGEYLYDHRLKGKSYVDGRLEFEGEYLCDKKWNGKGYDEDGNIIYELNEGTGKVKEYNKRDQISFDGEYLNGFRNGKGKEYDSFGHIVFEGEYLNGLRNGKGKEYGSFGHIVFEGEYLNGFRDGKGKEYNHKGQLIFEGEYFNGKKWNGYAKEYYTDGDFVVHISFEGYYINGEKGQNLQDKK